MKFTFVMIAAPFLLAALAGITPNKPGEPDGFLLLAGLWFFLDVPLLFVYWAVRIARLAWRSGERA